MTLKEKFKNILFVYEIATEQAKIDRCEKIAEEFAIGFAEWVRKNELYYTMEWMQGKRSTKQLLEIYKQTL
jgi:hypothetical protein